MKTKLIFVSLLFLAFGFGVQCGGGSGGEHGGEAAAPADTAAPAALKAVAQLAPTEGSSVTGTVTFEEQADGSVHVSATVSGLTAGKHGIHIHENGDCSAPDGSSAGGHFNPDGSAHGAPDAATHHAGDFGNLEADAAGKGEYHATYSFISLKPGQPNSIIGKSVIIHANEDDLVTQPTGGAGARLACGVIMAQ